MSTNTIDQMSNEMALDVLQQIPTPIMAVDKELNLIFMNDAGLKLSGSVWRDIKGKKVRVYDQSLAKFVESLGATPVPIGFSEVQEMMVSRERRSRMFFISHSFAPCFSSGFKVRKKQLISLIFRNQLRISIIIQSGGFE